MFNILKQTIILPKLPQIIILQKEFDYNAPYLHPYII
jgi:hypothetical protein